MFVLFFAAIKPSSSRNQPLFIPVTSYPGGNFTHHNYDWMGDFPFRNGVLWLSVIANGTNHHHYRYDLHRREVTGELVNAGVIASDASGEKLLCIGEDTPFFIWRDWTLNALEKISGKQLSANLNRRESLWLIDINSNKAQRAADIRQLPGTSSSWKQSPSGRYLCTQPTAPGHRFRKDVFVLDFETGRGERFEVGGRVFGWWDDEHLLMRNQDSFVKMNIHTRQKTRLFDTETIIQAAGIAALSDSEKEKLIAEHCWSGTNLICFVRIERVEINGGSRFLVKATPVGDSFRLSLVSTNFDFRWDSSFDGTTRHYAFGGESKPPGQGGNGSLIVRDTEDNSEKALIPKDDKGQYTIPRFFGNEIIYFRDRKLWRVKLDGSGNEPLFKSQATESERK